MPARSLVKEESSSSFQSFQDHSLRQQRRRRSSMSESSHKKFLVSSNRESSQHKWQHDPSIVGALEVPSDPYLEYRSNYHELPAQLSEQEFSECIHLWNSLKLKKSFIQACDGIPPSTACCGMVPDQNKTIHNTVAMLKPGWERHANKVLKKEGIKISCFVLTWQNAGGRAQTSVLLIRFHLLSIRRLVQIQNDSQVVGKMVEDAILVVRHAHEGQNAKTKNGTSGDVSSISSTHYDEDLSNSFSHS